MINTGTTETGLRAAGYAGTRERHYTYTEAASVLGLSVKMLRRAASRRAGDPRRLKVKRYGHSTVRITDSELARWDSQRLAA